jgi:hypothetical protein
MGIQAIVQKQGSGTEVKLRLCELGTHSSLFRLNSMCTRIYPGFFHSDSDRVIKNIIKIATKDNQNHLYMTEDSGELFLTYKRFSQTNHNKMWRMSLGSNKFEPLDLHGLAEAL